MDHREYTYGADLLRDRIIMVTGASDGIGREIALHAAAHGAQVTKGEVPCVVEPHQELLTRRLFVTGLGVGVGDDLVIDSP